MMKKTLFIVAVFCLAINLSYSHASTFIDFDDLPVTQESEAPGSSANWAYTNLHQGTDGWDSTTTYSGGVYNFVNRYFNTYNSDHMGWEAFGFMEIDDQASFSGKSLKVVITGGKSTPYPTGSGLLVKKKADYLSFLGAMQDPFADVVVGYPTLYFQNTSVAPFVAFPEASGSNRMSFYVYLPSSVSNDDGEYDRVRSTFVCAPFTGSDTNHYYHRAFTNGGGWMKFVLDGHPEHYNGWIDSGDPPYPSWATRDLGATYLQQFYRFYISSDHYDGTGIPPQIWWLDQVEFYSEAESQNNETINSPAVLYKGSNQWEISFYDKYRDNLNDYGTFELRYSFSPITNANWASATPAIIIDNARWTIEGRTDGKFDKYAPSYRQVWAPFSLDAGDTGALVAGATVYFAIKDIGNLDGNGDATQIPNTSLGGVARQGGRAYDTAGATFDWAGDQASLTLIKLISYTIPAAFPPAQTCTDSDSDGYGSPASIFCDHPFLDCNDNDPNSFPGNLEIPGDDIDQDCSGADLAGGRLTLR